MVEMLIIIMITIRVNVISVKEGNKKEVKEQYY